MIPKIPDNGASFEDAEDYYLHDKGLAPTPPHNLFYVFDNDGNAVAEPDTIKWAQFFGDIEKRIVQDDTLPGDVSVRTVFFGIADRHHRDDGQPVFWGTFIKGGLHDGYEECYISRTEAIAGHKAALKLAQEGIL
jgi:hypothetical protein